ncbi:MAG: hypothetical protein WAT39_18240, partial [Planctomycetota bacterium]
MRWPRSSLLWLLAACSGDPPPGTNPATIDSALPPLSGGPATAALAVRPGADEARPEATAAERAQRAT